MENMTIPQVLEITVEQLKKIMVPAEYSESIGVPVARSIRNLTECINAINRQVEAAKAKETEEAAENTDEE